MRRECPCSDIPPYREAYGAFIEKNEFFYKGYSENVSDPWDMADQGADNSTYLRKILKSLKDQKTAELEKQKSKEGRRKQMSIKERLDKEEYLKALRDIQTAVERREEQPEPEVQPEPQNFDFESYMNAARPPSSTVSATTRDYDALTDVSDETRDYSERSIETEGGLEILELYDMHLERLEELAGIVNLTEEEEEEVAMRRAELNLILDNMNIGHDDDPTIFDYRELRDNHF